MGKIYRKKTGIVVVSGRIESIAPDRMSAVIKAQSFDSQNNKWVDEHFTVQSQSQLSMDIMLGEPASAAGYQNGTSSILAQSVSSGPCVFNTEDTAVISGIVTKASYRPELNEDGTPKLKKDGTPRKPHFDICFRIKESDGKSVLHTVKVYNFSRDGEKSELSNIERMQKRFAGFVSAEETPIYATIATSIGQERSWENEYNGKVYTNYACDHMGVNSLDLEFLYEKEKQQAPAPEQAPAPQQAPAPEQPAPAPTPAPTPAPAEPVYGGSGEPVADEELPFM